MKLNDKITLSVAEAVKRVIEDKKDFKPHTMYDPKTGKAHEAKSLEDHLKMKDMGYTHEKPSEKNETEVQDSDKDTVDAHTVDDKEDPEQKKYTEETEVEDEDEDDVEEGNAFGQAVTDAKKAGKKKFKFQGKEYKVESVDLEEAAKPSNGKSTIEIDVVDAKAAMKDMSKFKLKAKAGSDDELIVTGKNVDIFKYLTSQAYGMDTDEIEEFYPELYESVDLEEAVKFWTVTITKKAGKLFKGQTVDVKASNSAQAIKKGIKQMKGDPITVPSGSVDAVLAESLEEAVTPADFVKGGDAKITKREVDSMLSKLFIDTKLAKAVESNSAFKAGEKSNGKKNPYKKDTADFHLFILGQQSAAADS
jgi:hypothetical protein